MKKTIIALTLSLTFCLLALSPVFAQVSQKNLDLVATIGVIGGLDRAWEVTFSADGNYAYIPGKGPIDPRVWIMDISDPANLNIASTIDIPNPDKKTQEAWGAQVDGNYLYVAAFKCGLWIYDITTPTAPVLMGGHVDGNSESRGLFVAGDYAYVAEAWNGLSIYDVSNPAAPSRLSLYNTDQDIGIGNPQEGKENAEFHGVKVVGNTAYCAAGNFGLVIVDVTDKAAPAGISFLPKDGWSRGVDVAGNFAYICENTGLRIADVSNPAAPAIVGAGWQLPGMGELWKIKVIGNSAYLPYEKAGSIILDVTDPANPAEVSSFPIAGKLRALGILGTNAYLVEEKSFHIVDISTPATPILVGTTAKPGVKRPWMVKVVGDYAYVADLSLPGLLIYDVSTPTAPVMKGTATTPNGKEAWDVEVAGDYAYVAGMDDGLLIFDVTDKENPTLAGQCVTTDNSLHKNKNSQSRGVKVVGNYAYVGDAYGGLTIVDISAPTAPVKVANIGHDDMEAHRLDVAGNYCYVGGGKGVAIVDITTSASPSIVSFLPKSDKWVRGARVLGDYVYYSEGLAVVNVADPAAPVEVSRYYSPDGREGWDCQLRAMTNGTYAFYGAERALRVLDVTNAASFASFFTPPQVAYYWDQSALPGIPKGRGIDVVGNYVYMAGEDPGVVCIFKFTEPEAPAPGIESIVDVPDDQGRCVRVTWNRSAFDKFDSSQPITMYGLWRELDDLGGGSLAKAKPTTTVQTINDMFLSISQAQAGDRYTIESSGVSYDLIATVPAVQTPQYSVVSPTLGDSTDTGIVWSVFVVSAHTEVPTTYFVSASESGYSVDNLAPGTPGGLMASEEAGPSVLLNWEASTAPDFKYFAIYKDEATEPIATTTELSYTDTDVAIGVSYTYRVTAFDFSGNEGSPAEVTLSVTNVTQENIGMTPTTYTLAQNYPNPFNPATEVKYQIPKSGNVKVVVYGITGQEVRTLVDKHQGAGFYSVYWDGKNNGGRLVPSGIYIYQMQSKDFVSAKRMILIK